MPLIFTEDLRNSGEGVALIVFPIGRHLFVLFRFARHCYVADGNDDVLEESILAEIQTLFGRKSISTIGFGHQKHVDHYGTSAVMISLISLNFDKKFGDQPWPTICVPFPEYLEGRIISALHKHESVRIKAEKGGILCKAIVILFVLAIVDSIIIVV